MRLTDNKLIKRLLELELPPNDFAVFGSGPLLAHGLKESVSDLDIVARNQAWELATTIATPITADSTAGKVVTVPGGGIEIFNEWPQVGGVEGKKWDVGRLIDEAEVFDGIRFVPLDRVLEWKQLAHRDKDDEDIKLIPRFLDLQGRMAAKLLELAVTRPVTQGELATMVGGARQSVNQVLSSMEARGYVRRRGESLEILDPKQLQRLATWLPRAGRE